MAKHGIALGRFTLVEIALALAVLAVGLAAVMMLITLAVRTGNGGRSDGSVQSIGGRMDAFLQGKLSAPASWTATGSAAIALPAFEAYPADSAVPVGDGDFTDVPDQIGLKVVNGGDDIYICAAEGFEAMVRVGVDATFTASQYYRSLDTGSQAALDTYPTNRTLPPGTRMNGATSAAMFGKFYRPLIVELSWPIDVPWSKRERSLRRLELFNENFVPYPPTP